MMKPKAGFVLRGGAILVDSLIVMVPLKILFNALGYEDSSLPTLIYLIYACTMTFNEGATMGKKYFGLKVVSSDNSRLNVGQVILREIVGKIISSIIFSLGYLWVMWDKDKQAWHDKIAGTYVVCETEISKGKKMLASIMVWILPILLIFGIFATAILVAINPAKQMEKARQMQENYKIQNQLREN